MIALTVIGLCWLVVGVVFGVGLCLMAKNNDDSDDNGYGT